MQEENKVKKSFFQNLKAELKKVIWPTGEQTVKSTFATIAFVILVSLVLIVFNLFFNWLSNLWINALSHSDVINNVVISGDTNEQALPEDVPEEINAVEEISGEDIVEPVVEEGSGE